MLTNQNDDYYALLNIGRDKICLFITDVCLEEKTLLTPEVWSIHSQ